MFASGSKVMVTSRSRAILKSIFGEEKYCEPISRLETHEARELFLSVAAPKKLSCELQPLEDEIVKACLGECQFAEDGYATRQYHPLVLRALGSYFYDVDEDDIMNWKEHISVGNKLQGCRESKRVNKILGLNYSSLLDAEKLVFLDVALLLNVWFFDERPLDIPLVGSISEVRDYKWRVSFIATMHGISPIVAERKVKELQRKSLIYEGSSTLELHDLYMEFAESLVMKEGSREREWWVFTTNSAGMNFGLMKRFCAGFEKVTIFHNLERLKQCERLECLVMVKCKGPENLRLDMGCLKSLRVLVLEGVAGMVEIVCNWGGDGDEECLQGLRIVRLSGKDLKRIPFLTECSNLKSLSMNVYEEELVSFIHSGESKIFEKLMALEVLCLHYHIEPRKMPFEGIFNCISSLKSLKSLDFTLDLFDSEENLGTTRSIDMSPLGGLPLLFALSLDLPELLEVHGLDQLSGLITFELYTKDSKLNGVDQLSQLRTLNLESCKYLCLSNLDKLPNLREVCVSGCCSLEDSTCLLENYEEIKHHTNHKCHQLFCNTEFCGVCVQRHLRSGATCQVEVHCGICYHLEDHPGGCDDYKRYVMGDLSGCFVCSVFADIEP